MRVHRSCRLGPGQGRRAEAKPTTPASHGSRSGGPPRPAGWGGDLNLAARDSAGWFERHSCEAGGPSRTPGPLGCIFQVAHRHRREGGAMANPQLDQLASTRSAPWRWTPSSRPTPGTRARRWRWRPSPTASGSASCASTRRPDLAEPRPLRALGRPRVDAALLAAAPDGRQGGQPEVRDARRAVGHARRHQAASASSTAECPGHPEYRWTSGVETTTGPARPGRGQQRRHGDRRAAGSATHFNRPGFDDCSTSTSTPSCGDGCMMEGISSRGRLARRAPEALQPLLDLRQQPHHHRGQHRAGLQRGRRHALPRLRLERHPRRRRQRPRDARARLRDVPGDDTTGRR